MRFVPPSHESVHIALTSGHTALVTPDGAELPSMFHREAIARGCRVHGMTDPEDDPAPEFAGATKNQLIERTIMEMLDGSDSGDFTADGKPNIQVLSRRCGFTVSREERDAAWATVTVAGL